MTYPSVHNTFKERVANGQVLFGLWAGLGSSYAVEVVAGAGYDWILIDSEHSPADLENVLGQLEAMAAYRPRRWFVSLGTTRSPSSALSI